MSNDWQFLAPMGVPQPGTPTVGGGGTYERVGYRDILDARRSVATPRTPDAEYPDGYLGNVASRREDRLLSAVKSRLTERSYQRGVHKGEKIPAGDYMWPDNFNPMSALEAQARGTKRWGPVGSLPVEQINHMGKNHMLAPEDLNQVAARHNVNIPEPVTAQRAAQLQGLRPTWK